MTNLSGEPFEADWHFVDGSAKVWDGEKWRRFKWAEAPGWYDFQGVSHYWNGTDWEYDLGEKQDKYRYVSPHVSRNAKLSFSDRVSVVAVVAIFLILVWLGGKILVSAFLPNLGNPTKQTCTTEECIQAQLDIWSQEDQERRQAQIDKELAQIEEDRILEENGIVP